MKLYSDSPDEEKKASFLLGAEINNEIVPFAKVDATVKRPTHNASAKLVVGKTEQYARNFAQAFSTEPSSN